MWYIENTNAENFLISKQKTYQYLACHHMKTRWSLYYHLQHCKAKHWNSKKTLVFRFIELHYVGWNNSSLPSWIAYYFACRRKVVHLCYRQDAAKWQTAGIKFSHRPKITFFALQGRLVAPIHVKPGRNDGHVGPLGCAKFHLNRPRGLGMRPQKYQKFPLFVKSPHRGDSLDRFLKF